MKGIFVVMDGVADENCKQLGDRTPLDVARTPHLDWFASQSTLDHCFTVKEGVAPESSAAVVSLLGFDPATAPRGSLEAMGADVKLVHGDLALRVNFATIDGLESGNLLDQRAGRTLSTHEAQVLARAVNENVTLPFPFELKATVQHRGVVVFRGGFSDMISNADPFYSASGSKSLAQPKIVFSHPLDEEPASKLSSDLLNQFLRQSHEVLDAHPLNVARAKKGLYSANFLLCRDPGIEAVRFKKLKGKWMGFAYMPLEIGIARAAKMNVYSFAYPPLKGIDVYDNLYTGLRYAIKNAIKMLKWNYRKYDYFYIHFKETDLPGHDNKPLDKVKMIEMLDEHFFSFLHSFIQKKPSKVVITADHTTSCRLKAHSDKPVPLLYYNPAHVIDKKHRFNEQSGMMGRKVMGRKVLEKTLFS